MKTNMINKSQAATMRGLQQLAAMLTVSVNGSVVQVNVKMNASLAANVAELLGDAKTNNFGHRQTGLLGRFFQVASQTVLEANAKLQRLFFFHLNNLNNNAVITSQKSA